MIKHKIVEVIWFDAALESAQMELEDAKSIMAMPRKNVGYLLRDDKKEIVIGFGLVEDEGHHNKIVYDQVLVIPRGIIKEVRVL